MTWRLVLSLAQLRADVRTAAPRAVPPATPADAWGTIADDLHDETSDHAKHLYPVLGAVPVVCAADFPHAPALGLDGARFTEALRQSRDPRISYVIHNRRIFSGHPVGAVAAYTWRPYTGSDPHDTHWHVSVVHTAAADDPRPWQMPGTATTTGADDMFDANDRSKLDALFNAFSTATLDTDGTIDGRGALKSFPVPFTAKLDDLTRALGELRDTVAGLDLPVLGGPTEEQLQAVVRDAFAGILRAALQALTGESLPPART